MLEKISEHEVFVTRQGSDEAPNRMFIHCSLGRSETLAQLNGMLPERRVVFFDLPGHGRSPVWAGEDFHSDVADIVMKLRQDGPTHLVGHSFGATVAVRLAGRYPDLWDRVTLIEPVLFCAASGAPYEAYLDQRHPFLDAWHNGDKAGAARVFLSLWGDGPDWEAMPERAQAQIIGQMEAVVSAGLSIEEDKAGIIDKLGQITCPVDLIEGGESQPIMSAIMDGLEARLPQSCRTIIEGAGHMLPLTHAAQIASALNGV